VILKRTLSDEMICSKLHMVIAEMAENPDYHEKLYVLGGILGKGLRDGIGLDKVIPKRKGGLEGILFDLIGGFVRDKVIKKAVPEMQVLAPNEEKPW
jgi:hypothetical protein